MKKKPKSSRVEMTQIVLPAHTNMHGTVFGGQVMAWIDVCGAVAARRHCEMPVVTASMDQLNFLGGARDGQVVVLKGIVNYVGRTSMEVGVRVEAEALGGERTHTGSAYLTFVAVDSDGRPQEVPGLEPETEVERRRYEKAKRRRDARLQDRREARERERRHGQEEG